MDKRKRILTVLRWVMVVFGGLLMLDTALVLMLRVGTVSNLGVVMPFIIGLPPFVIGVWFNWFSAFFTKHAFGRIVKWLAIAVYALFALLFTLTTVITVSAANAPVALGADVVIVLGCGVRGTTVTKSLAKRLDVAYEYLSDNPNAVCIVTGGKGPGEDVTEAYAMSQYLLNKQVAQGRIYLEQESASTIENFRNSKEIIDELFEGGASSVSIVFVTSDFHIFRAGLVAQKAGVNATPIASSSVWYITLNNYLRECAAITQYWLTGEL